METINKNSENYLFAQNKVKEYKRFYRHFTVYLVVNSFIIGVLIYDTNYNFENFWRFETFSTAIFWGIGLLAHAASVFGKDLIFNKDWEQKKIQEFMEKDKKSNWE